MQHIYYTNVTKVIDWRNPPMGKLLEFCLILLLASALSVTFLGAAEALLPGSRE